MFQTKKTLIALALSTTLISCGQKTAQEHFDLAKKSIEKQDYNSAVIELKNAIAQDNTNGNFRFLLANTYFSLGNLAAAEKELLKSIELNHQVNESTVLLNKAYFLQRKFENIINDKDSSPQLSAEQKTQNDLYLAIANLAFQDREKAINILDKISNSSVSSQYAKLAEAYKIAIGNDLESSRAILTQLVHASSEFTEAKLLLAQILSRQNKYEEAAQLLEAVLATYPGDNYSKLSLATIYLKSQDIEKADKLATELLKLFPDNPTANQIKGTVAYTNDNIELAQLHIEKAVQNGLRTPTNMLIAGLTHFRQKNHEQAYNYLKPIEKKLKNNPAYKRLLLITELSLGYDNDASNRMSTIEITSKYDEDLLTKASLLFMQKGNKKAVRDNLTKLSTITTENVQDNLNIGLLKLYSEDLSGLINIEKALELSPDSERTLFVLFAAYIEAEKYEEALTLAQSEINKAPNIATNYTLAAVAFLKLNDKVQAEEMYNKALEQDPNNLASLLYYLNSFMAKKDWNQAIRQALKILDIQQDNLIALNSLLNAEQKSNNQKHSIARIKKATNVNRTATEYTLLLAKAHFLNNRFNEVIELLDADNKQHLDSKNRILWGYLVTSYKLSGNLPLAEKAANHWVNVNPDDHFSWLYLIDTLDQGNKYQEALIRSNSAQLRHPAIEQFNLLKVYFTLFSGDLKKAEVDYKKLSEQLKSLPLGVNLKGNLLASNKKYLDAIPHLLESYKIIGNFKIARQVFLAYVRANQSTKAVTFLEEHINQTPQDLGARLLLANQVLTSNQELAIKHYEFVSTKTPSLVVFNNLAWLYLQRRNTEQAEENIAKALELDSKNINVLDTAASIAIAQKNIPRAKELLQLALIQQPNNTALKSKLNSL